MKVGGQHVRIAPFGLVDGEKHGLARAPQRLRDEVIFRGQARLTVGQEDQPIRFGNGAIGLDAHRQLEPRGVLDQAARVDRDVGNGSELSVAVLAVTCDARDVGNDGVAGAGQAIEKRGFPDVRAADNGNDRQHELSSARIRWRLIVRVMAAAAPAPTRRVRRRSQPASRHSGTRTPCPCRRKPAACRPQPPVRS